jgi:hypothetical protein
MLVSLPPKQIVLDSGALFRGVVDDRPASLQFPDSAESWILPAGRDATSRTFSPNRQRSLIGTEIQRGRDRRRKSSLYYIKKAKKRTPDQKKENCK